MENIQFTASFTGNLPKALSARISILSQAVKLAQAEGCILSLYTIEGYEVAVVKPQA